MEERISGKDEERRVAGMASKDDAMGHKASGADV